MGKLWGFIDKDGLYKIDLSSFKIEDHYKPLPEYDDSSLRAFHVDKKGNIWLGTINGLYILNPSSRELSLYKHSGTDPFSLPNNSIWEIYEDRQDNVWIGTYSGTLSYVNVNENHAFRTYHTQNSGLNYAPVSAFAEEQDYIWIGTEGGGINRMNKVNGEISGFTLPNNVTSKNVKSLVIDAGRNLWISTFRGGLDLYDSRQNKAINYKHSKKDSCSLLVDDIRKTVLEGDSGMWISYQYHKPEISYFSFHSKSFTHFSLDSIHDYAYLFDILRQGEKTLWAISNEALYQMDTHTRAVEKIIPNDSTYLGLFTFCLDDSGNIWIGTIGNGLIKFDTNTSHFISLKNVLQQDIYSIYSICYDNGNVWMGTDNGLFCYNIADNQLMRFDKRENTQGQVYYPLATMKGRDGLLYFGGTNGFTVINPKNISYNSYKPKAIISDFFIDHQAVHPNYTLNDTLNCIILDYDQVNNEQREIIYKERRQVLDGENMREAIYKMIQDTVDTYVDMCFSDDVDSEEWDLNEFNGVLTPIIPIRPLTAESVKGKKRDEIRHELKEEAVKLYEEKEAEFPEPEQLRELERVVLLKCIDSKWMDHIDDMEILRQGIGLAAYGQRDPVVEYKMSAFDMFNEMITSIQEDTLRMLYHVHVEQKIEREQVAKVTGTNKDDSAGPKKPVQRKEIKVYPNDPCPCGSGKKYKQCCGRKNKV